MAATKPPSCMSSMPLSANAECLAAPAAILQLLLGDKLQVPPGSSGGPFSGTTSAGVAVAADVLLMATGITTNSGLLAQTLPDALDPQGRVKVRNGGCCELPAEMGQQMVLSRHYGL